MRIIYCNICGKKVGEIRDGSLMKGLVFCCPNCSLKQQNKIDKDKDWVSILNQMSYLDRNM